VIDASSVVDTTVMNNANISIKHKLLCRLKSFAPVTTRISIDFKKLWYAILGSNSINIFCSYL